MLERAAIVCGGNTISTQHLPTDMLSKNDVTANLMSNNQPSILPETFSLPDAVQTLEIRLITDALKLAKDNKSRAAKLLDISERTLWYKLSRYHIVESKPK